MRDRKIFILSVVFVFSFVNVCLAAYDGKKLCNMGAEMQYKTVIDKCYLYNRIPKEAFSQLYQGNDNFYYYYYHDLKIQGINLKVNVYYNQTGYVNYIIIWGNHIDMNNVGAVIGMCVANLYALGLTESECTYLFSNMELVNSLYTLDGSYGETYTSGVFSSWLRQTIGVVSNVYKDGKTALCIMPL